jgi:endoglucanase
MSSRWFAVLSMATFPPAFAAIAGCSAFNPDVIPSNGVDDAGQTDDSGQQMQMTPTGDDGGIQGGSLEDVGPVGPPIHGLHVAGNQILNDQQQPVVLHGVNRSGTEYKCIQGGGIFDGPSDESSIQAIASWKANAVRIPLNESCWLGPAVAAGVPVAYSGDSYKNAIIAYVALLHKYNIVPILDLHWVAAGTLLAVRQQPMPDAQYAPLFWADVATTFQGDDGVVFEAYNEPYPDMDMESTAAWSCWKSGCTMAPVNQQGTANPQPMTYVAAGMQDLVSAIRQAEQGIAHVILLGGVEYSNDLKQWLTYEPIDPTNNLGAAWHVYSTNACNNTACWNGAPAAVAAGVPIVATEIGENDCGGTFISQSDDGGGSQLMQWLDSLHLGYLAWSWDAFGMCRPASFDRATGVYNQGNPWPLVTDYGSGTPNSAYAQAFHDHILGLQ